VGGASREVSKHLSAGEWQELKKRVAITSIRQGTACAGLARRPAPHGIHLARLQGLPGHVMHSAEWRRLVDLAGALLSPSASKQLGTFQDDVRSICICVGRKFVAIFPEETMKNNSSCTLFTKT